MRPTLTLLAPDLVERILDEAFALLLEPGVKVEDPEAVALLVGAGGRELAGDRVAIPEAAVRTALATALLEERRRRR